MSKEDLAKYATDWSTPTVLNSNSEPEHEPVEFTHAVSPKNSKPEISEPTTPSKVQGSVLERPGWAPEIPSEVCVCVFFFHELQKQTNNLRGMLSGSNCGFT